MVNHARIYRIMLFLGSVAFLSLIVVGLVRRARSPGELMRVSSSYEPQVAALIEGGDFDRAVAQLRLAERLDVPQNRKAILLDLSKAASRAGDVENEIYALRGLLGQEGVNVPKVCYDLSSTLLNREPSRAEDLRESIEKADRSMRRIPGYPPALRNQGLAWLRLGDQHRAVRAFRECVDNATRRIAAIEPLTTSRSTEPDRARLAREELALVRTARNDSQRELAKLEPVSGSP